ncbi:phosphatidylserine decarboxylase family protein [Longimonas halophila]|uniref:Phosphatidylserine decarboxylase proenzyme n=1 Tax=Longimonas halophila TaxID=1469170 RepID=A0A2H3P8L0_9BACT|nr:phosphatidylserine decarboxylase [Longimonas halophila]PEN09225.1 phosphatidylserine decarboxylase family protein [Longimonas halophila]
MSFAPEGYLLIGGAAALTLFLVVLGAWLGGLWLVLLGGLGVLALGFTVWFFRDPERHAPAEARTGTALVAPADGKVVELVEDETSDFIEGPVRRCSIFLSPLNVHVNRVPATGTIAWTRYVPGDYLVAWHPKASEKNERSEVGMHHTSGIPIVFKQIAGAVARRIEFTLHDGQAVEAGARYGIVKFGSRMDVLVPASVEWAVDIGMRVRAGETIIGHVPASNAASASGAASTLSRDDAAA